MTTKGMQSTKSIMWEIPKKQHNFFSIRKLKEREKKLHIKIVKRHTNQTKCDLIWVLT